MLQSPAMGNLVNNKSHFLILLYMCYLWLSVLVVLNLCLREGREHAKGALILELSKYNCQWLKLKEAAISGSDFFSDRHPDDNGIVTIYTYYRLYLITKKNIN